MADPQHHVDRVASPLSLAPQLQLFGKIGSGLSGERRVSSASAFATRAMAGSARLKSARWTPLRINRRCGGRGCRFVRDESHARIMSRNRLAVALTEALGDVLHFRVPTQAGSVIFHLPGQIAETKPGHAGNAGAIPFALDAVTRDAGAGWPGIAAAQRDQFAVRRKRILGTHDRRTAARHQHGSGQWQQSANTEIGPGACHGPRNLLHASAVPGVKLFSREGALNKYARWLLLLIAPLAACKPAPDEANHMGVAGPAKGLRVIKRVACTACHIIPGVSWPRGEVGPNLDGFGDQTLIAGRFSNQPGNLALWVRNAPTMLPGTAMPAMPISEEEARDVAAYLYTLRAR